MARNVRRICTLGFATRELLCHAIDKDAERPQTFEHLSNLPAPQARGHGIVLREVLGSAIFRISAKWPSARAPPRMPFPALRAILDSKKWPSARARARALLRGCHFRWYKKKNPALRAQF